MRIECDSIEEFELAKKIFVDGITRHPHDNIAAMWSVNDVRDLFPKGTPNNVIYKSLKSIERKMISESLEASYDVIQTYIGKLIKNYCVCSECGNPLKSGSNYEDLICQDCIVDIVEEY